MLTSQLAELARIMGDEWRLGVEVAALVISVGGILFRLGGMTKEFRLIGQQQAAEIKDLKEAVKEFGKVLVTLAQQDGRMQLIEERQLAEGRRLDNLDDRFNKAFAAPFKAR